MSQNKSTMTKWEALGWLAALLFVCTFSIAAAIKVAGWLIP